MRKRKIQKNYSNRTLRISRMKLRNRSMQRRRVNTFLATKSVVKKIFKRLRSATIVHVLRELKTSRRFIQY